MLFRSVFASLVLASAALATFNPTSDPVATPVYDDAEVDAPLTNAARFQRGLGPLPPVRKRFQAPGPVQIDYPPPPVAAPSPSAVAAPPVKFNGHIQVANAQTGQVLGYIAASMNRFGELGLISAARYRGSGALSVSASVSRNLASTGPFSIRLTNGSPMNLNYLGAVAAPSAGAHGALQRGKQSYAYLARTAQTKAHLPPATASNSFSAHAGIHSSNVEAAIWAINPISHELSATWTNPDGSSAPLKVFYHKAENAFAVSTDPTGFQSAFRGQVVEVELKITSH